MTWSYSRLTAFEECPYRWFLTYLYRDPKTGQPLRRQSGFFAEFGSFMHMILQLYLSGTLRLEELPVFYIRHFAGQVRARAPNDRIYRSYFEQGLCYLDSLSFPKREILGVERQYSFTFAGKPWIGYIDLCSMDGEKLILTDHKSRLLKPRSGRAAPTKSDLELDAYLRQLYVYSAAVHEHTGRWPDELEFNCFRGGTLIREPFLPERCAEVEEWARGRITEITVNDTWKPHPDYWRCNYLCDVCADCEYRVERGSR